MRKSVLTAALVCALSAKAEAQTINAAPVTPFVASGVTSLSVASRPRSLYGVYAKNNTATAGFLAAYNAAVMPASGAALDSTKVLECVPIPANGLGSVGYNPGPAKFFDTGLQFIVSTTDCGLAAPVYTPGAISAYISAIVK